MHEMRAEFVGDLVRASCSCGGWSGERQVIRGARGWLGRAHAEHVQLCASAERLAVEAQKVADARAWYARTGHCGECGQPGEFCLCTRLCRCAGLHPCGSGVGQDAVAVFAAVGVDQDPLW